MTTLARQELRREPPPRLSDDQLRQRFHESFPESAGPGVDTESGLVTFGGPPHPRIGPIPVMAGTSVAEREAEAAERAAREATIPAEVRAAKELVEAEMRQAGRRF